VLLRWWRWGDAAGLLLGEGVFERLFSSEDDELVLSGWKLSVLVGR
jgi:hypothetical protein